MPSKITDSIALLRVPFAIRHREIFPVEAEDYADALEPRQHEVIEGLRYYASENFRGAMESVLNFLNFMITERFPRSVIVDEELLDALLDVFERKFRVRDHAIFAERLLNDFSNLRLARQDDRTPGHGRHNFALKVVRLIELIRKKASSADLEWDWEEAGQERSNLEKKAIEATIHILESTPHDLVRDESLRIMLAQSHQVSPEALEQSGFYARLAQGFYRPRASALPESAKEMVSDILVAGLARGGKPAMLSLKSANTTVAFAGQQVPVWLSLQNERFPNAVSGLSLWLAENSDLAVRNDLATVNRDVAEFVGARGNNSEAAGLAINNIGSLLNQGMVDRKVLVELSTEGEGFKHIANWPGLQQRLQSIQPVQ